MVERNASLSFTAAVLSPASSSPSSSPGGNSYPLGTQYSLQLMSYFRSGWAFLIPYLAAYLLYAWLEWPVNLEGTGKTMSEVAGAQSSTPSFLHSLIPPLLYVYWFLHALHLLLGGLALSRWWQNAKKTAFDLNVSVFQSAFWPLLPWFCLAMIFWIPGIYLEWPSDPWEHLRRINEWHSLDQVAAHSSWKKSSYFLPYSLTGHTAGILQLRWLNVYYTAVCLLLSWHYYRLARAVDLGERASFIFVVLGALTFGNNIFSFYRYYGLASSIFAQLGAVALTRVALEALATDCLASKVRNPPASRCPLLRSTGAGLLLFLLIAYNHVQGLAIAGLGVLAVGVWRLLLRKRTSIFWLTGAAGISSMAAVMLLPGHPAIDEAYRPQGWLTAWYGFDLVSPESPAFVHSRVILGTLGAINLILGLWLVVRKNHVVGWLTLTPVIALALPCFALPLAHVMAAQAGEIATFHRFLFAVPTGLAFVTVFASWRPDSIESWKLRARSYALLCIGLVGAVVLSAGTPSFNRLWHALQVTPEDLQLRSYVAVWTPAHLALAKEDSTLVISPPIGTMVKEAFQPGPAQHHFRSLPASFVSAETGRSLEGLSALGASGRGEPTASDRNWQLFIVSRSLTNAPQRVANLTAQDIRCLQVAGPPANQIFSEGRLILSNPPSATSSVFIPDLIPVDRAKRYLLSSSLRQTGDPAATSYLAVAWYDANGTLLPADHAHPLGAGEPRGWANGTFSYYGVVNQPTPPEWTSYTVAFGLGEVAAIPANAAFIRVGALLNYSTSPATVTELTNVVLSEKPAYKHLLLVLPTTQPTSAASQAALLSGHWSPHRIFKDLLGSGDRRAAGENRKGHID